MQIEETKIRGRRLGDINYRYAPGLTVVTAYYNPMGYKTRRHNYELFANALHRSGIPLLTVECAFGEQPYDLPESMDVVRVRGKSPLWQKERLISLGISWLPASCKYVAWMDCDLVHTNPRWAQETVARLQQVPVVQVFECCTRLPRHYAEANCGPGDRFPSFGAVAGRDPSVLASGEFPDHGHTGFGWAARREVLDRHGLYEYAVAGSADHFMAHAALGDYWSPCIERHMAGMPHIIRHFRDWAEPFYGTVQGKLGVVPGEVLHLWHGDFENRRYIARHVELANLQFDPYTDLSAPPGKPLELRADTGKRGLVEWFSSYFASRLEDGAQPVTV